MNAPSLRVLSLCGLVLAFAACKPNGAIDGSDSLQTVLALETAQAASANKQVVLIASNAVQGPGATVRKEFKVALEKQGLSVVEIKQADLGDPMRYDEFGLKATDFLEVMRKHSGVGAIISLVGAPLLRVNDFSSLQSTHPPVLVVATRQIGFAPGVPANPGVLEQMLNAKIIQVAIVEGAGTSGKSDKAYKTFDQNYRIFRANP